MPGSVALALFGVYGSTGIAIALPSLSAMALTVALRHEIVAAVHVLRAALLGAAGVEERGRLAVGHRLFHFGPRHHLEFDERVLCRLRSVAGVIVASGAVGAVEFCANAVVATSASRVAPAESAGRNAVHVGDLPGCVGCRKEQRDRRVRKTARRLESGPRVRLNAPRRARARSARRGRSPPRGRSPRTRRASRRA